MSLAHLSAIFQNAVLSFTVPASGVDLTVCSPIPAKFCVQYGIFPDSKNNLSLNYKENVYHSCSMILDPRIFSLWPLNSPIFSLNIIVQMAIFSSHSLQLLGTSKKIISTPSLARVNKYRLKNPEQSALVQHIIYH